MVLKSDFDVVPIKEWAPLLSTPFTATTAEGTNAGIEWDMIHCHDMRRIAQRRELLVEPIGLGGMSGGMAAVQDHEGKTRPQPTREVCDPSRLSKKPVEERRRLRGAIIPAVHFVIADRQNHRDEATSRCQEVLLPRREQRIPVVDITELTIGVG